MYFTGKILNEDRCITTYFNFLWMVVIDGASAIVNFVLKL